MTAQHGPQDSEPTSNAVGQIPALVIVGTGIKTAGQLTQESIAWMRRADALLYVVGDPVAETVIKRLNPDGAVSLAGYYKEGAPRLDSYHAMIDHIVGCVQSGLMTVGAFYGHPGVFAYPSHESIRRVRAEGHRALMLPGISAEDCLFADLGVDPAVGGCQSYEATDFLLNDRLVDTSAQLILWQVGTLGDWTYKTSRYDLRGFPLLVGRLSGLYGPQHVVAVYEAAALPGCEPITTYVPIAQLNESLVSAATTLYVPPCRAPAPNHEMRHLLAQVSSEAW